MCVFFCLALKRLLLKLGKINGLFWLPDLPWKTGEPKNLFEKFSGSLFKPFVIQCLFGPAYFLYGKKRVGSCLWGFCEEKLQNYAPLLSASFIPFVPIGSHILHIIAHLSLPWSIGWVALSFLVRLFVCSFVRPVMVASPLLHAPDPQTHTFSESLW